MLHRVGQACLVVRSLSFRLAANPGLILLLRHQSFARSAAAVLNAGHPGTCGLSGAEGLYDKTGLAMPHWPGPARPLVGVLSSKLSGDLEMLQARQHTLAKPAPAVLKAVRVWDLQSIWSWGC